MSTTITLDPDGRLSLPADWCELLSLKGGAKLKADLKEGRIELTPEPEQTIRLVSKRGLLVITGIAGPVDAVAAIAGDREAREAALSPETSPP